MKAAEREYGRKMTLFKHAADRIKRSGKTWEELASEFGFASAKIARKEFQKWCYALHANFK